MSAEEKKRINTRLLGRVLGYTAHYRKMFIAAVLITLGLSCLAIVRPLLISSTLNNEVVAENSVTGLNKMCLLILSFLILEAGLQIINIRITNLLGQNIVRDLRNQVYNHILRLKNAYFDNTPVGTLVTRAISDIENLNEVFAEGFIVIAGDLVMLIVFTAAMFWTNWVLALLALSTIPLLFIATAMFKRGVKTTFTQVRNAVSALNTFTQEHLMAMRIVQLFNRENDELEKFRKINAEHRRANIRSIFYYSVFFPVVEILSSISIALVIWFAGSRSGLYHISLGDITFFVMMVNMFFRPIRMLADRLNTLQMGLVSAERVFKVLDTKEFMTADGARPFQQVTGSISFKNVSFSYRQGHPVLRDASFEVPAGSTTALVGATGAGKSTVISLLGRYYEYDDGQIMIDGHNIREYDLHTLRKGTGIVLQDVHLFNDSVLQNITLGDDSLSEADVIQASREIGLYDFVMSLPGGFHYQVTERGQGLSAGQRQLIAFIRAYVHKPAVFILDEATATIDTRTEILLQKAVRNIAHGRTSIIIAHRLSTIRHADQVLVFEAGRVIERGSVNELLSKDTHFRRLYELQNNSELIN